MTKFDGILANCFEDEGRFVELTSVHNNEVLGYIPWDRDISAYISPSSIECHVHGFISKYVTIVGVVEGVNCATFLFPNTRDYTIFETIANALEDISQGKE